jgi:hypothetical protein
MDEEAPGEIELDTNTEGYPILPDNAMDLQLENKKTIIRKYMFATRSTFI